MADKALPGYKDHGGWFPLVNAAEEVARNLPRGANLDPVRLINDEKKLPHLVRRVPNGYFDPRCMAIVCHELARTWQRAYIRSPQLTGFLNQHYPTFLWDAITVGRLLGAIYNESLAQFEGKEPVFLREFDARGRYYVLQEPSLEGRAWLLKLRELFLDASEKIWKWEKDPDANPLGLDPKTLVSVFEYVDAEQLRPVL